MNKWKRMTSSALIAAMLVSTASSVFASGTDTVIDSSSDITNSSSISETEDDENTDTETPINDASDIEGQKEDTTDPSDSKEAAEKTSDAVGKEESSKALTEEKNEKEEKIDAVIDNMDFSSGRLLVKADASTMSEDKAVISEYGGLYLLQYDTEQEAMNGYAYYADKAEYVEPDISFSQAEGELEDTVEDGEVVQVLNYDPAETEPATGDTDNAFDQLEDALDNAGSYDDHERGTIVLLDSGVDGSVAVADRVSLGGNGASDATGHGTKMANAIFSQDKKANIVSVKVTDESGKASVSSVYAGIEYAISTGASYINLSMVAKSTVETETIRAAVEKAYNSGIIVVGAAGNNGENVSSYIPGNIGSALIVGAADKDGSRLTNSNYGATVDYNVVAGSTSEASAIMTGWLSKHATFSDYEKKIGKVLNDGLIYETGYEGGDKKAEISSEKGEKFAPADAVSGKVSAANHFYTIVNENGAPWNSGNGHLSYSINGTSVFCGERTRNVSTTGTYVWSNPLEGWTSRDGHTFTRDDLIYLAIVKDYLQKNKSSNWQLYLQTYVWAVSNNLGYNYGGSPINGADAREVLARVKDYYNANVALATINTSDFYVLSYSDSQKLLALGDVTYAQTAIAAKLRIEKSAEDTSNGASGAGAVFGIYTDESCAPEYWIRTLTTDSEGNTEWIFNDTFSAERYAASNPDLVAAGLTTEAQLLNHWMTYGINEPDNHHAWVRDVWIKEVSPSEGCELPTPDVWKVQLLYEATAIQKQVVFTVVDPVIANPPEVSTTAIDDISGTHTGTVSANDAVTDTVSITNAKEGKEYILEGVVMDRSTGEKVVVNGKELTASKEFTADAADMKVDVNFAIDSSDLSGKSIVFFEYLYEKNEDGSKGERLAFHEDINDESQTIHYPSISTKAAMKDGNITDTVSYKNCVEGDTYTLISTYYDAETGRQISVNGQPLTGTATFEAGSSDGEATVTLNTDITNIEGKTIVVFEELYAGTKEDVDNGNISEPQSVHKDLSDKDQTVSIPKNNVLPRTGGNGRSTAAMAAVIAMAALAFIVLGTYRRKRTIV